MIQTFPCRKGGTPETNIYFHRKDLKSCGNLVLPKIINYLDPAILQFPFSYKSHWYTITNTE